MKKNIISIALLTALAFMVGSCGDDETTAISTPATQAKQNDTIYNMNGMRVQNPQRGLYIMNGKKVMIK